MTSGENPVVAEAPAEPAAISFADLGLDGAVLKALSDVGYETPSAIQAATIPTLLAGRDVVGLAQTGTGKTAAFALPILARLDESQKTPQALVLAPTRELALQVCEAFEKYASRMRGVHILPVYGGQGYGVQLSALRRGVHIVVGTPGRIMDHLEKGTLDLSQLKYLVLDEADEMLKMGFAEDVETILADTPADKQVALFSATMPSAIRRISKQYLNDPEEITVKTKTTTSATITQRYLVVAHQQKIDALTRILEVENFEGMIVFVRTKSVTEEIAEKLRARGYSAAAINGDIAQAQRERTVNQLKSGKLDILVATDVAARGLDVERISHVVNFDIPTDTESYVHRIGRTGRAGRSGDAISFATPRERRLISAIEKATRQELTQMQLPSVDDVNVTRLSRFDDSITAALAQSERIDGFRDIIGHYMKHHDVPEVDVAAALAVVAQGEAPLLLDPAAERPARGWNERDDRGARNDRDRDDRRGDRDGGSRGGRYDDDRGGDRRSRGGPQLATYRIAVGRRHKVEPRQIVGALANEGGLRREDFGAIQIRPDFSLVELPADLPRETLERLDGTRISGRLIELRPDRGAPQRRDGAPRRSYGDRDDKPRRSYGDRDDKPRRSYDDKPPRSYDDKPARSSDDNAAAADADGPARKPRHKGSRDE
ncbi:DEAD/DEAH box helicase [Agromyces aureus]|uniref:ATP-dependent RNA helicase DeaD n=1 Tax=Agromyces aureus TaxID=453304 RepID=A0A191WBY6_9MICO|nr:DEAD/DEAH box helicase [Agromyces aureus]ANJ25770.1 cold-shock protein [Agromyces aureus]